MRFLFLLLLPFVSCVEWRSFAGNRRDSGVLAETGYETPLLAYIWHKYGYLQPHGLVATLAAQDPFWKYGKYGVENVIAAMLYAALWYIHVYPSAVSFGQRNFEFIGRISTRKFYEMVVPVLVAFSDAINEINYNDRLHPANHGLGIFENYITCFVDTAPIFVKEPRNRQLAALLMQPKYGCCVYKFQIAVSHMGWICYYSGPHHGTIPDNIIYENTYDEHPLKSWEYWCGDGIYNSCFGVITRFILEAGSVFTRL